jgi:copper chaperone
VSEVDAGTEERTYRVTGMTCAHCVAAVTETVSAVPGAQDVDVDLDSGCLAVSGHGLDDDAIRAAVEDAGYAIA